MGCTHTSQTTPTQQKDSQIRFLLENREDIQKLRIEAQNRIIAYVIIIRPDDAKPSDYANQIIKSKVPVPKDIEQLVMYHNMLEKTETTIEKFLADWSKNHILRKQYLDNICGIGPVFASGLIAWLAPINRFDNISKLWSYCALSAIHYECKCEEGHKFVATHAYSTCPVKVGTERTACNSEVTSIKVESPPKRKAGYLLMCNTRMHTLLWKIATSFEKQKADKCKYRKIYDQMKAKYYAQLLFKECEDKGIDTTSADIVELSQLLTKKGGGKGIKGHARNMALRYIEKRFLADLWLKWRELEGLPVSKPYSIAILGHSGYEEP